MRQVGCDKPSRVQIQCNTEKVCLHPKILCKPNHPICKHSTTYGMGYVVGRFWYKGCEKENVGTKANFTIARRIAGGHTHRARRPRVGHTSRSGHVLQHMHADVFKELRGQIRNCAQKSHIHPPPKEMCSMDGWNFLTPFKRKPFCSVQHGEASVATMLLSSAWSRGEFHIIYILCKNRGQSNFPYRVNEKNGFW